ncbi:hypothetical protein DDB_G0295695 [Dictyostelium discoideum AX4]|uniref:BP74 N-terminal domain-containing protein n=1 Tax=Dictyostelium discoideum TaxID=44689 RepID=B0G0Z8_DICDI|nr:hypothetical protein DDB_G0295695 [Dictyostelium discoideum AX4]EDR41117.1 hypothetical protein DDB_G0295695 [Dictyostelium discoideum AX4]|eukprot:XP_001732959.1 hypothetical protein DDB_G0295695 [Dictyostelium discoideum AX4]
MKLLLALLSLLLTFSVLVQSHEAYFGLKTNDNEEFVFKLIKSAEIQKARKILSGKEEYEIHVMGNIKKKQEKYNPNYSFILDPNTIDFFDIGVRICDVTSQKIQDNIDRPCSIASGVQDLQD